MDEDMMTEPWKSRQTSLVRRGEEQEYPPRPTKRLEKTEDIAMGQKKQPGDQERVREGLLSSRAGGQGGEQLKQSILKQWA